MDFSTAFVASMISGGKDALKLAVQRGIQPEYLDGQGKEALAYVLKHMQEYKEIPSRNIIMGKTGIDVGDPDGAPSFYVEECLNIRLHTLLKEGLVPASKLLSQNKPKETLEAIQKLIKEINKQHIVSSPSVSVFSLVPDVMELYEKMKAGDRGIPFPFPSLNESTLGIWPQDLVIFVARTGIGKTFMLVLCANVAWKAGARVLLATTEMAKRSIAQRVFADQLKLPYSDFKRGSMSAFAENKMKAQLLDLMSKDDDRFRVIGGDFDFHPSTLQAEIDDFMPDVVFFDGAYLMKTDGNSRTEQAAGVFNELKRIGNQSKVGMVASTQFNREVKKNSPNTAQIESVGLTDVAGWNADAMFALLQTEDMEADRRMHIKNLKTREGAKVEDFDCVWDIPQMKFEEILKQKPPSSFNPFDSGMGNSAPVNQNDVPIF